MRYSDFTIFSDLDGTLLPFYAKPTPRRNVDALEKFTADGGRFAIATGRPAIFIEPLVSELPVNAPCILLNGSAVYDFEKKEYPFTVFLPEIAREYIEQISRDLPHVGITITHDDDGFDYSTELELIEKMSEGGFYNQDYAWRALRGRWFKALFICRAEQCDTVEEYLRAQNFAGVDIVRSGPLLVEMLPLGSSKGNAMQKMYELGVCKREATAAIGDYHNDIEMLSVAGVGACVKASPQELRDVAVLETCSCEDGAIADLIEYLMRVYP